MHRLLARLPALIPAALLGFFSFWAGTFPGGADSRWALAGHLALLGFVAIWGQAWPDPMGLARPGNVLLAAFAVTLAVSAWISPVPRAGKLALLLLPAFLLVPSAVARCWATEAARRLGVRALAVVVAAVAGGSLVAWWRFETPGASLPLGHHNLLAAWLLMMTPLAAAAWRDGAWGRSLASVAVVSGLVALWATRSLGATVAVGVLALVAAARHRTGRWFILAAGLLLLPQAPRLLRMIGGGDLSTSARWSYLEAGWRGFWQKPVLGWGPGSASWTLNEHLRPLPGVHPPDQVVADFHSWPLEVAYELGGCGLILGCGLIVAFWRRPGQRVVDPLLRLAAVLGLSALAIMSVTGLRLAVAALPLAAMIGVGAVLASEAPRTVRRYRLAPAALALTLAVLILPLDLAHLAYDRAVDATQVEDQRRYLRRAVELDPGFPLYRARLAWLAGDALPSDVDLARQALAAAEDAYGLAPLWLVAGIRGQAAGEPWSRRALLRACQLSPLGAMAPFRLALSQAAARERVGWAGRALLAEPRLLVATDWANDELLVGHAVEALGQISGVEAGWRQALEEQYLNRQIGGAPRQLALQMDARGATSISLHAFRRWPWPRTLERVGIAAFNLSELNLVAAARLETSEAGVFAAPYCGIPTGSRP